MLCLINICVFILFTFSYLEVPATPLDLKVQEIWSRSASVTWSSPYTGNSPITKYVLQYWRDAGKCNLTNLFVLQFIEILFL